MIVYMSEFFPKKTQRFLEIFQPLENLHRKQYLLHTKVDLGKLVSIEKIFYKLLVIWSDYTPKISLLINHLKNFSIK